MKVFVAKLKNVISKLYSDSSGNPLKDQIHILETSVLDQHGGIIGGKKQRKQR